MQGSTPKRTRKANKRQAPQYVYTLDSRDTGRTELRYGGSYEAPIYEFAIRRVEIHQGRGRQFIRCYRFEEAMLGEAVIGDWIPPVRMPADLVWVRHGEEYELTATIKRTSKHWSAPDTFPREYYTQRQIENRWRKEREKLEAKEQAEQAERERNEADNRYWDDLLAKISAPRREAKELLGVSLDCTPADIRRAYHRLAIEHHPDRGGDIGRMAKINEAYALLEGMCDAHR